MSEEESGTFFNTAWFFAFFSLPPLLLSLLGMGGWAGEKEICNSQFIDFYKGYLKCNSASRKPKIDICMGAGGFHACHLH